MEPLSTVSMVLKVCLATLVPSAWVAYSWRHVLTVSMNGTSTRY